MSASWLPSIAFVFGPSGDFTEFGFFKADDFLTAQHPILADATPTANPGIFALPESAGHYAGKFLVAIPLSFDTQLSDEMRRDLVQVVTILGVYDSEAQAKAAFAYAAEQLISRNWLSLTSHTLPSAHHELSPRQQEGIAANIYVVTSEITAWASLFNPAEEDTGWKASLGNISRPRSAGSLDSDVTERDKDSHAASRDATPEGDELEDLDWFLVTEGTRVASPGMEQEEPPRLVEAPARRAKRSRR